MNHTLAQQRALRTIAHHRRVIHISRPSNAVPQAAHPRIAGALATVADRVARGMDKTVQWIERGGSVLLLAGALAVLWARSAGWLA